MANIRIHDFDDAVARIPQSRNFTILKIKLLDPIFGNEGGLVRFEYQYEGKPIKTAQRVVKYNSRDGLYIVLDNRKFFEYELEEDEWVEIEVGL